jgi:hypothetical protein
MPRHSWFRSRSPTDGLVEVPVTGQGPPLFYCTRPYTSGLFIAHVQFNTIRPPVFAQPQLVTTGFDAKSCVPGSFEL